VGGAVGDDDVAVFDPILFVDGADHEVGEEADDQEAAHDVEDERIGVLLGCVGGDVVVEDAVDDERSDDTGGGPGGEEAAVNGGDVEAAEEIFEIGGDGGEASAVHGDDDGGDADEERDGVEMVLTGEGKEEVEDGPENEEDEVGCFASDEVGDGGPEKASGHVEDAEQADEADGGSRTDSSFEEVLDHGCGLLEDADAGGDVDEEHDPEEPELRGLPGLVDGDVVGGDESGLFGGGDPSGGLPAVGRYADGEDAEHHEDEVEDAHGDHGVGNGGLARGFEVGHEVAGERTADHGSAAEAHDGEAGGEAGAVGEPLDEGGDGGDVAEAETDASDDAVAEVDEPKLMAAGSEGGDDEAKAEADGSIEHGAAWAGFFEPGSEERGGDAEDGDGDGEDVADFFEVPRCAVGSMQGEQGIFEDGEGINLADGEVNGEGGRRDKPTAIAGGGYGTVAIEKCQSHMSKTSEEFRYLAFGAETGREETYH
jgi:hypothetical protein